jgi:ribonuclease Z
MQLHILGTAGYHPSETRHTTCMMIPEVGLILDAGTGFFRIRDLIQTATLDIVLSHAHLDHVMGLTFLFDVLHERDVKEVNVHGAASTLATVKEHLFAESLFPALPPIKYVELPEGSFSLAGATVSHMPLVHPSGSTGYRFDWPEFEFGWITDTTADTTKPYVRQLAGVDLLLHECNFPDGFEELAERTGHSTTTPVAEVAKKAAAKRLIVTHFNPLDISADPIGLAGMRAIFPNADLAEDGMVVDLVR